MDENDLFSLAQQAGTMDPATPSYADQFDYAPPESYAPQGGFSDEDILAHFVPQEHEKSALFGNDDEFLTPPTDKLDSPFLGSAPPAPTPGSSTSSMKQSSYSQGQSGFSGKKNQQIRKGPGAVLDNEIAGIKQEGAQTEQQRQAQATEAAQGAMDAAHGEALATKDYLTAEGHQKHILATLQQQHDAQTEAMIQGEYANAQVAKASYIAALNDFRAARVNPGQLFNSMNGVEQVGTLASAFLDGFLAPRGIQVGAMDIINKAIDRNINAQVNAINNKGQVAEGFKTLWDMQMAESHSMQEARTRMRGFMLDAMKTQVEANLSGFNAALATAKGRVAVAKLDQELAKTLNEISQHVDANTNQRIQQAIQRYGQEMQASMESARIAVEAKNAETNRQRLELEKQAKVGNPIADLVYDNSKSGGGYANGIFKPGIEKEEKIAYRKAQSETNHLTDLLGEYQALNRQYGNQGPLSGTRLSKEQDARLREIAGEIMLYRSLKFSGKSVTTEERKIIETGNPNRIFAMTRDIASQLADTEAREREALNRMRETLVFDLPTEGPGSEYRGYRSGMSGEGAAEIKEAKLIGSGEDKKKSPEQVMRDGLVKDLEKHSAYEKLDEVGADTRADHEKFRANHPELGGATVYSSDGKSDPRQVDTTEAAALKKKGYVVRDGVIGDAPLKFERGLTGLKTKAQKALEYANEADDPKEKQRHMEVFDEYVQILQHEASSVTSGTNPNDPQGLYAKQMLEDLGVDTSGTTGRDFSEATGNPKGRTYTTPSELATEGSYSSHEELPPDVELPPIPHSKRKRK